MFDTLSFQTQRIFQAGYGVLLLGTLLMLAPNWRIFFLGERWGGYAGSGKFENYFQRPASMVVLLGLWILSASVLALGGVAPTLGQRLDPLVLPAALVCFCLSYQFFIRQRWSSLLRGLGAPGFMCWWCAAAVLILDYCARFATHLSGLALLTIQVDFAIIMLSAGVYKVTAGYPRNHGLELGMVNPMWGYWSAYRKIRPTHLWIQFLNHGAWISEILGAVLMLIPATRMLGAVIIAGAFLFIATHIRLGLLTQMVVVSCLIFLKSGSSVETWIFYAVPFTLVPYPMSVGPAGLVTGLNLVLQICLWTYLFLRPLAWLGLCYNFYGARKFPQILQAALERYTNAFGIILWRVFTSDVTCFCIEIYARSEGKKERHLSTYSRFLDFRFGQVGESIAVTTIFTALKYFSDGGELFRQRLVRYTRTLDLNPGEMALYKYIMISKDADRFRFNCIREYLVDPTTGTIKETVLDPTVSVEQSTNLHAQSKSAKPGSYAPGAIALPHHNSRQAGPGI